MPHPDGAGRGHWSNFVRFAQKAAVLDFAEQEEVFSLTDIFYGKAYSWMVTTLGPNPDYGSELLVFNLAMIRTNWLTFPMTN